MYSNNNYAFFFFIILCFAPLISAVRSLLREDYYDNTCSKLQHIVRLGVWNATLHDSRMRASLLRLHFHDCFVNGCDASVLLDGANGEQNAPPNIKSLRGFEVIDNIKRDVEKWCPNTVSCADILTLAARAAVELSLEKYVVGPWKVVLGRLDGMVSNKSGAISDLPSPLDSVDTLIAKFDAKDLNIQDMVVLSGAHTIGFAQCFTFKRRLYPSRSSKPSAMNPNLLHTLQGICPNTNSSNNITAPLDRKTEAVFDNIYYKNLVDKAGVLKTDQDLASDKRTSKMVDSYSKDQALFFHEFGVSMANMGKTGVITARKGQKGEIRSKCGSTN